MKTCLIISGGDFSYLPSDTNYDYVIACDAGYSNAQKLGITPDLVMGDFDSYNGNSMTDFYDIPVLRFNVIKDDTDTMLAVKKALELGYGSIIIACALGGRLDHTFANIQCMSYATKHGARCKILTSNEELITLSEGTINLPRKSGYSLSLFSLTDTCENVCIEGAKYTASDITLTNSFPLGVSNEWSDDIVNISVAHGILLIVMSRHID